MEVIISGARTNAGQNRFLHGTPPPADRSGGNNVPPPKGTAARRPGELTYDPMPVCSVGPKLISVVAPLNLANSQSLDLLTGEEQALCSQLRVLPKPYLAVKELYLRENALRHGGLRRREAR